MFERLLGKKQETPQEIPVVIKRVAKIRRGKKTRVAAVLTESDFREFKRIGNVVQAHNQLGISKGVLYMWNKLGNWKKIEEFKAERALEAKTKLHKTNPVKAVRTPKLRWPEPAKAIEKEMKDLKGEFPVYVYLGKLVQKTEETNKLLTSLVNEIKKVLTTPIKK